jgi:hypothetical protein
MKRPPSIYRCGSCAMGWPAMAQELRKSARIGFIVTGEGFPRCWFDAAMHQLGWIEGRNLTVERG